MYFAFVGLNNKITADIPFG